MARRYTTHWTTDWQEALDAFLRDMKAPAFKEDLFVLMWDTRYEMVAAPSCCVTLGHSLRTGQLHAQFHANPELVMQGGQWEEEGMVPFYELAFPERNLWQVGRDLSELAERSKGTTLQHMVVALLEVLCGPLPPQLLQTNDSVFQVETVELHGASIHAYNQPRYHRTYGETIV